MFDFALYQTTVEIDEAGFDMKRVVARVFKMLPERERLALEYRYGFRGAERTYEELGEIFDVSKERARQITERAFRMLDHPKIRIAAGLRYDLLTSY